MHSVSTLYFFNPIVWIINFTGREWKFNPHFRQNQTNWILNDT